MDKNFKNIENIFKDNFKNLEIKPDDKVWAEIDNKIWLSNFKVYFNNLLNTSNLSVGAGVWTGISRKLWLKEFLSFNLARFNIYYSFLIIIIGSTFVLYSPDNSIIQSKKIVVENSTISSEAISHNEATNENIIAENTIQDSDNTVNTNQKSINTKITVHKSNESSNKTIVKTEALKLDTIITHESISQPSEKENLSSIETRIKKIEHKRTLLLNNIVPNEKPSLQEDTIGYDFKGEPIIADNSNWSLDFYVSPLVSTNYLLPKNKEYSGYIDARQYTDSPVLLYSGGVNLNYNYKNLIVQSGVNLSALGETYNYENEVTCINTIDYYRYETSGYMEKDTISYLNLDSLMMGDTSYVSFIEYNWITTYDSILVIDYDTLKTIAALKERNMLKYYEIPLLIGFHVENNKYSCSFKGGVIAGLLYQSRGLTMDKRIYTDNITLNDKSVFMKTQFSLVLAANLAYKLNQNYSVFAEPYLRKTIKSIYPDEVKFSQKYESYGLKLGVRYQF